MSTKLKKLKPLLTIPSFTSKEAAKLGISAALLSYYVKTGELERLGYGIYRGINAPSIDDFRIEDLVTALMSIKHGIICLISALTIYELTEELPRQHWIAISHGTRNRTVNTSIKIIRMRNTELGKTFITVNKVKLPIFDRERTIVDCFRYLSIETAIKALRLALNKRDKDKIDLNKLASYARTLRVKIDPYVLGIST